MTDRASREGFHTITPYIMVPDAEKLIDFVKTVFDARETLRSRGSAGGIHVEVQIGESMLMIGGAGNGEPWPAALYLYLPDVDAIYQRSIEAGASSVMTPEDQDYGDRLAGIKDTTGNIWYIATHQS